MPRSLLVLLAAALAGAAAAPAVPATTKTPEVITLVDPGRPPSSPLRMELTEGTTVRATIETRRWSQATVDGIPRIQERLPPVRVTASTIVESVVPKGDATLVTTYDDVVVVDDGTVADDARAQLETLLAPITGVVLTATVSPRNEIKAMKVDGTAPLDGAVAQLAERFTEQLGATTVPFPREPVGVGARWQLRSRTVQAGLTLDVAYDYFLREAGTTAVVDVEYVRAAPRQRVADASGLDSAARVDVTKYRLTGTAEVTLRFSEPAPVQSSAHVVAVEMLRVRDNAVSSTRGEKLVVDVLATRETGDG